MLLIHVPKITNRIKYIFSFILQDILRTEFNLTKDKDYFISYEGPKFCYGKQAVPETLYFAATNLLFEDDIYQHNIEFISWNELKVFFSVNHGSALPFDIFSASFYLVSRYAEYLPHTKDRHGRFNPEDSANFKGGFLDRPILNIWANYLKLILSKELNIEFSATPYIFTPTININNPYSYKYKGAVRNGIALSGHLFKFQFKRFSKRLKVILGAQKDPYDSYEEQNRIHKKYNLKPHYFVLLGDYGKYDKNLSHKNKEYISLIQALDKTGEVCLHASYESAENEIQMHKEKQRLENILQRQVTKSRQRYLKINIPYTYRMLINVGIREDYSMGYASKVGFRAGTCTPFYFFDIEKNQQTELKIFPFTAMDTTLKHHLKMRSKEVISFLDVIVNEIKPVGGNFIFIFHNESIGNSGPWRNWGNLYEKVIQLANRREK
jgi:hypothetical protein